MKKTLIITSAVILGLALGAFFISRNLPQVVSFLLSRDFGFKVSIQELDFYKGGMTAKDLKVFSPKPSDYDPALKCETIEIDTTWKKLRQKRLTIDEIWLDKINMNIQFYDSARKESNFNDIANAKTKTPSHKEPKPYLIKKLVLNNLDILLIFHNGKTQNVQIKQLVFTNISEKSGFPIEQLEKAILHAILRKLFDQLGIPDMLNDMIPKGLIPEGIIPKGIPKTIPFF